MNFPKSVFSITIPEGRIFGLDLIRAAAILIVVYQHGAYILPKWAQPLYSNLKIDGVTVFFVLSGFLIGRILIKILENRPASFSELLYFWCRRWFRTLPIYYIMLTFAAVIYPLIRPDIPVEQLGEYYVFLQNFNTPHPKFNGIAWSLSVEEWFYIIVPTILFGINAFRKKNVKTSILIVSAGVLLFSFGFRHFRFANLAIESYQDFESLFRMQVLTRIDSTIIGLIGAYIFYYHHTFWNTRKRPALYVGLAILLGTTLLKIGQIYLPNGYYACVLSFQVEALGTLCILPFFSMLNTNKHLLYRAITVVSLVSYSAYLVHNTIVIGLVIDLTDWYQIIPVRNLNILVKYIAYLGLTLFTSILCYKYLELPLMKLRDSKLITKALLPKNNSYLADKAAP